MPAEAQQVQVSMEDLCLLDTGLWARHNKIRLSSGADFSFKGHEYLQEPYQMFATAPWIAVLKGSQVGLSELGVLANVHGCAFKFNVGAIYYFPTDNDVTRFSKGRFTPLLMNNPGVLGPMIRGTNDVHMKYVNGRSHLHFLGLNSPVSVKMTPADCLTFDEYDEVENPEYAEEAHQRIEHSRFKWLRYLSTPTMPDLGVDAKYKLSDQRHRMIYCEACHKYTCMEATWPDCIHEDREGRAYRACINCGAKLNLSHPRNEWVPKYPGAEVGGMPAIGYWLSQLQSVHVNLQAIWEQWVRGPKYMNHFMNHRLAQAHADSADRLEVEQVLALSKGYGMESSSEVPCAIGVDVGPARLHVVVLRPEPADMHRIIWIGTIPWDMASGWAELDQVMRRFNGKTVIDGLGEPERAGEWVKKYRNRAWVCTYTKKSSVSGRWSTPDDPLGRVTVYQDTAMVRSHRLLAEGKCLLPRLTDKVREFARHCHAVMRKKVINEEDGSYYHTWAKTNNEDHYRRAFNFAVMAAEKVPTSVYGSRHKARLRLVKGSGAKLANSYKG